MELPSDLKMLVEVLVGRLELTSADVARDGGLDLEQARRLWRALGFPPVPSDARIFTRADVDVLHVVRRLLDEHGIDLTVVVQLTRLIGRGFARIADAQVEATAPVLDPTAAGLPAFVADFERLMTYVWRRQLLAAILRRAAQPSVGESNVAVGFADMVGFTTLSQALDAQDLAAMVDRFEAMAYEHVTQYGGRVIKLIGDEVMFAADDPGAAAHIALALAEGHAESPDLPAVRVGLAHGPAVAWDGDLFGPTVNLASRLVNVARPSTVLISEALAQELRERPEFELRLLRALRLQGIGRVRSFVLRRTSVD